MLVPGMTFSSGKVDITAGSGTTPDYVNQGFGFMTDGSLAVDTDVPAGDIWNAGRRLSAAGALYGTTTAAADDVWLAGIRFSALGQLVYEAAAAATYQNGNPQTATNFRFATV